MEYFAPWIHLDEAGSDEAYSVKNWKLSKYKTPPLGLLNLHTHTPHLGHLNFDTSMSTPELSTLR
jgi:hypothetical protein